MYNYTAVGGDVPFVYSDLRNRDTWRSKGDVTSFFYAPIANHVCSYLCFTARVGRCGTSTGRQAGRENQRLPDDAHWSTL